MYKHGLHSKKMNIFRVSILHVSARLNWTYQKYMAIKIWEQAMKGMLGYYSYISVGHPYFQWCKIKTKLKMIRIFLLESLSSQMSWKPCSQSRPHEFNGYEEILKVDRISHSAAIVSGIRIFWISNSWYIPYQYSNIQNTSDW